jgi:8-oxo-dGTP diphosphatase
MYLCYMTDQQLKGFYGGRLRVRVCGLLEEEGKILLVRHVGLGIEDGWWNVPGGGMEYGSEIGENLRREFKEETGLEVVSGQFLKVHEHLDLPLHAVELFYKVKKTGGHLQLGADPETKQYQSIADVQWMTYAEVLALPTSHVHPVVRDWVKGVVNQS